MTRLPVDHRGGSGSFEVFDHLDPDLLRDPSPTYARLRAACPVGHSARHGGFAVLSRYRDVAAAARDHDVFSSRSISLPDDPVVFIPINLDGAEHAQYRSVLAPTFSPRRVAGLRASVRDLAGSLIDRFADAGSCDLAVELTRVVPSLTLFRLIGIPPDDEAQLSAWTDTLLFDETATADDGRRAAEAMQRHLYDLVARRRRALATASDATAGDDTADADLVAELLGARVDGRPLDDHAVVNILVTLVFGGIGPTTFLLNGAVALIDADPGLRRRLLDDPGLLTTATEEFLRLVSPVQSIGRVVSVGERRLGHEFHTGDRVLLLWGSANRDVDEFADPESFVADRVPNRHLAFGSGVHRCLGAHLARVEFQEVIGEMLARLPDVAIADDAEVGRRPGHMSGIHRLPVTFTPAGALRPAHPSASPTGDRPGTVRP